MNTVGFSTVVMLFAFYSVLGWVCDELFCAITSQRWVMRGFLHGPYCTVYGFGALIVLFGIVPLGLHPALLFPAVLLCVALLEYFASWLMEKLFGLRWWDYSGKKLNLNGRVCLLNSLLLGALGLAVVYAVQPPVARLVDQLSRETAHLISSLIIVVFLVDLVLTLNSLVNFKARLHSLRHELGELDEYDRSRLDMRDVADGIEHLNIRRQEDGSDPIPPATVGKILALAHPGGGVSRIAWAFPTMKSPDGSAEALLSLMEARNNASKEQSRGRSFSLRHWLQKQLRVTPEQCASAEEIPGAAARETAVGERSFAAGVNFYKLCWVFVIACVIGYVVEMLYCFVTRGHMESRQGMLYGPFSQIYGFGAMLLVLALHRLAKYKGLWLFLGSALIGGAFEWVCSWVQEMVFGTYSWDYSMVPFSIGGRTRILFMVFWGLLGLFFIRVVYPPMSRMIERIPNRPGYFLTWMMTILLCVNMLLSAMAVARWNSRVQNVSGQDPVARWLDDTYPNDYMQEIYPNMNFAGSDAPR